MQAEKWQDKLGSPGSDSDSEAEMRLERFSSYSSMSFIHDWLCHPQMWRHDELLFVFSLTMRHPVAFVEVKLIAQVWKNKKLCLHLTSFSNLCFYGGMQGDSVRGEIRQWSGHYISFGLMSHDGRCIREMKHIDHNMQNTIEHRMAINPSVQYWGPPQWSRDAFDEQQLTIQSLILHLRPAWVVEWHVDGNEKKTVLSSI